MDGAIID